MYELDDPNWHTTLGVTLNNAIWGLLDKAERTEIDDRKMVAMAHGALYHWERSPKCKPVNRVRGHWMISRVHAVLGQGVEALEHANTCWDLVKEHEIEDFDRAYALEAMGRAHAACGNLLKADEWRTRAAKVPIAEDGDRRHFVNDLATGPWFGLD